MDTHNGRRGRVLGAVLATASAAILVSTPAAGQDAGLGGYALQARSSAMNFTYELPGALPTGDVIFQASMPESLVRSNNGNGHALSSLAWPGPLVAEAGAVAGFLAPPDQQPPDLPPYPVRSDAFHPQGPAQHQVEPGPGARMLTEAVEGRTESTGTFSNLQVPLMVTVGNIFSNARATTDGSTATSVSTTTMSDIVLLGGLIQIDDLESHLRATTDGVQATASSHTNVSGVTFGGMAATIDEDGIHLVEQEPSSTPPLGEVVDQIPFDEAVDALGPVVDPVSEALREVINQTQGGLDAFAEQSGISIRQLPDESTGDGGRAGASAGGVLIEIFYDGEETPVMSDVLDQFPFELLPGSYDFLPEGFPHPPLTPQAIALMFKETHVFTITLANGDVSVNASEGFVFNSPTTPASIGGGSGVAGTTSGTAGPFAPSPPVFGGGQAPLVAHDSSSNTTTAASGEGFTPVGIVRGIPNFWLLLLFVLGVGMVFRRAGTELAEQAMGTKHGG